MACHHHVNHDLLDVYEAIKQKDYELVTKLCKEGIPKEEKIEHQTMCKCRCIVYHNKPSVITCAAQNGQLEIIKYFINEHKLNVKQYEIIETVKTSSRDDNDLEAIKFFDKLALIDYSTQTLLTQAILHVRVNVVKFLSHKYKADEISDNDVYYCFEGKTHKGNVDLVGLASALYTEYKYTFSDKLIKYWTTFNHYDLLERLKKDGYKFNVEAVNEARKWGNKQIVDLLIE